MPLFHIAGSAWALSPMNKGVTCILMEDVDPGLILRHIGEDGVTKVLFVPAVILFLMQHPDSRTTDFSSLKLVTYGASPIPLDLLQQAVKVMGCDFMQLYGMTEATGAVTYLPAADHDPEGTPRMRGVGIPIPPSEIRVVDPDGNDMPPGEVGEILVRSPQVMLEYWNRPEATAEAVRDGWYWSGDAGFFDEDGYLYMHDRIKDMVISGGENVYPAEVESCLFEHDARRRRGRHRRRRRNLGRGGARLRGAGARRGRGRAGADRLRPRRASPTTNAPRASSSSTSCRATRPARSSSANSASCTATGRASVTAVAPGREAIRGQFSIRRPWAPAQGRGDSRGLPSRCGIPSPEDDQKER